MGRLMRLEPLAHCAILKIVGSFTENMGEWGD